MATCLAAACVLAFGVDVTAAVVSWNKDVDSHGTVAPGITAGLVPVMNWNNSLPANNVTDLIDSNGNATTLDINPASAFVFKIQNSDPGLDANGTANQRLLNGYLNSGTNPNPSNPPVSSVQLTQIPYSAYDLYVYFSSDTAGRTGSVSVGQSSYAFNTLGPASFGSDGNAVFQQADASSTVASAANYAVFSRLVGSSQTVTVDIPNYGGIAGFQVVEQNANALSFSINDAGVDKSVPTWGVDAAIGSAYAARQSIANIGQANVDAARVLVFFDEPLVNNGGTWELNAAAKAKVDTRLNIQGQLDLATAIRADLPLTFGTAGTFPDEIDESYVQNGVVDVVQYARAIKATQEYINSKPGYTNSPIMAIEAYNEPDFELTYANPTDLNNIIAQLKTYTEFQNTLMVAPSTLNSDVARGWYDQVPQATAGSSHLLAGSLASWTDFIDHVNNTGKPFVSMELHSMGEILAGADRGMEIGMVWAEVLRGRGTLIRASDGERLSYTEDRVNQAAAAVYRAPDGQVYAFAGGLERDYTGTHTSFRFESEELVYFNGIPVREYYLHAKPDEFPSAEDNDFVNFGSPSSEGSFATIDPLNDPGIPALDGYRWKIVNVGDNTVMAVVGQNTLDDGAQIRSALDGDQLTKMWRITRTRNGYYHLYNANSGKTAEVAGGASLNDGHDVRQWGMADNQLAQWYVEEAANDSFYIRNAFSNKFLDADLAGTNIFQFSGPGGANQQWKFVLANPTHGPAAHFSLEGNVNNSAGMSNATAFGNPSYGPGPSGAPFTAIDLDGSDDYVQLPNNIANSEDITIATWVKWDGGGAWQRIFDFGNDTNEYMFLTPASNENRMHFGITTSSDPGEYILETDPLPLGEWVHLTLTLGGNTGILYVDGVPQVAGQILPDPTDFNPTNNFIGESQWVQDPFFNGSIADFQVFDYALHPSQVADLIDPLPGDFNGDGIVNLADYTVWRDSLDSTGLPVYSGADGDGDGAVTVADYQIWKSQFGQGLTAASHFAQSNTAVPEPSAVMLLLAGGIAFVYQHVVRSP